MTFVRKKNTHYFQLRQNLLEGLILGAKFLVRSRRLFILDFNRIWVCTRVHDSYPCKTRNELFSTLQNIYLVSPLHYDGQIFVFEPFMDSMFRFPFDERGATRFLVAPLSLGEDFEIYLKNLKMFGFHGFTLDERGGNQILWMSLVAPPLIR